MKLEASPTVCQANASAATYSQATRNPVMAKTAITADKLKVKIFADGADKAAMLEM